MIDINRNVLYYYDKINKDTTNGCGKTYKPNINDADDCYRKYHCHSGIRDIVQGGNDVCG